MSSRILHLIQRVVRQELAQVRGSLLGIVTAVFPHEAEDDDNNYEINVRLKHEELELRRAPLAVGHIGVAAPPRVGDLVLVQFVNGDVNQPVVTGRFYHADERPPLHNADDVLFEHRVGGKLNHLRFAADGAIYIQQDVAKPEANSEAKAGVTIDPDGNIALKAGDKIVVTLTNQDNIEITADGQPITINCSQMTVNGDLIVSDGSTTTTISGSTVQGG
jgi:uncharacterized protein involved in type VI secretion and phage assembly